MFFRFRCVNDNWQEFDLDFASLTVCVYIFVHCGTLCCSPISKTKMKNIWDTLEESKPAILMVLVQITFAACNVFYKLSIDDGMSTIVTSAYRLVFASATTIPLALIFERKRPKMTWRVFIMAFLSGLFAGTLFQNLFYGALTLASATLVSAIYNLIPSMTFIMAVAGGFEKLNWGAVAGKAKVVGTLLGLAGAMLLTFYKGLEFDIWPFRINLLQPREYQDELVIDTVQELLGVLCVAASCFCFSLWLIIQAKMSQEYPCYMTSIALLNSIGAIQSLIFGFCVVRDLNEWRLGWDIRLLTSAFSGILASGVMIVVMAWCVRTKGPLFASAFNPLMLVIVAIAASLTLDERLYLGSLLGAVLIVCGLYAVLWGKSKEMHKQAQLEPPDFTEDFEVTRPLLNP
ncbi:WAT1-related protein [Spatholobus suberectus]|nr:WAT1-related protein [Spatholobus suberectus]